MKAIVSIALAIALSLTHGVLAQEEPQAENIWSETHFDTAVGVGFAVLNVSNMEESVAYYTLLGFTVTRTAVAHCCMPGAPENKDVPLTVFQIAQDSPPGGLILVQHDVPVTHGTAFNRLGLRNPDVAGACKRLAEAGTPCLRESRPGSAMPIAWAKDPDGYLLELVQHNVD